MADSLREQYFDIIMEQVRNGQYPSPTMMDRIEGLIGSREQAEAYVVELLGRLAAERYPSPQVLDRICGLIDVLEPRSG